MNLSSKNVLPIKAVRPSLRKYLLAFLAITTLGISGFAQAQLQVKLALCLDGTGSMSPTQWTTELEGTASGLHEALYPDYLTGEVEVTIIVFSSSATTVIPPTLIDNQAALETLTGTAADTVPWTGTITGLTQPGGTTNFSSCINEAVVQIGGTDDDGIVRIIDLSTDGAVNQPSSDCGDTIYNSYSNAEECSLIAADNASAAGIDVLNILAVGLDADDLDFLRVLTLPTPNDATTQGLLFTPPTTNPVKGDRGFVVDIASFDQYQPAITAKIEAELRTTFTVNKVWNLPFGMVGNEVEIELTCTGDTIVDPPNPTLTVNGTASFDVHGYSPTDTCTATELNVPAYVLHEDGDCQDPVNIASDGDCTMYNEVLGATFTVNKEWIFGDPPGDGEVMVELTCTGADTMIMGQNPKMTTGLTASFDVIRFTQGTTCTATELTNTPNFDIVEDDCVDAPLTGEVARQCTIYNYAWPLLTLEKTVINLDGGTATQADFTPSINGTPVDWDVAYPVSPFTVTTIAETVLGGYAPGDWVCDMQATQTGPGTATFQASEPGSSHTCTIINDDIAPTLTLVKTVTNDNGGNKQIGDFDAFIDGDAVKWGTPYPQEANVLITASEGAMTGYTASAWGTDCAANGTITLLPGENKICTITNDDVAPTVTLIKTVDGGDAVPDDFQAFLDPLGDPVVPVPWGVPIPIEANLSHGIFEDPALVLPGYSPQGWGGACGPVPGAPPSAGHLPPVLPGENVTCTLTNRADDGRIEIALELLPDLPDLFDFFGATASTLGHGGDFGVDVRPGAYQTQTPKADIYNRDWLVTSFTCDDGDSLVNLEDTTDLIALFNVGPGETVRCTLVLMLSPDVPIPVNSPWALLLLTLMMLATGWYFRPAGLRKS